MAVVIPPSVDRGNSSYPLMAKMRMAPNVYHTVKFFGVKISSKLVPVRQPKVGELTGAGVRQCAIQGSSSSGSAMGCCCAWPQVL